MAIVKTLAERAVFAWLTGFWTYWLISTLALQFFVYSAIVAAAHGLEYYRRSREREQLEARLADARLQLLNVQLQPHFLFNTLNTIAEIVHDDPEKADYMITSLSDLLRQALELGATQEISLDRELDLLARYSTSRRHASAIACKSRSRVSDDARRPRARAAAAAAGRERDPARPWGPRRRRLHRHRRAAATATRSSSR